MVRKSTCSCGKPATCKNGQCRECRAASDRRYKYGLTPEDYTGLWSRQRGKCALCYAPATDVDHDHATGKVRGLLCHSCNTALGQFGDTIAGLGRAIGYLFQSTQNYE